MNTIKHGSNAVLCTRKEHKDKYHIQKEIFGKVKDPSYMIYSFWLQNLNIRERIVS